MWSVIRVCRFGIAVFWVLGVPVLAQDNWPQFRGSEFNGVARSAAPIRWDARTHIRWKVRLDGEGWSCPVVWANRVFVTAAIQENASDARPEPYTGGGGRRRSDLTNVRFRWEVMCFDSGTGSVLWRKVVRSGKPRIPRHSSNTFATETPVTDGERIYAYFGMNGLYCLDLNGHLQWSYDLGAFPMRAGWGTSSSPVLHDGLLFLQVDNEKTSFVIAIDAETGTQAWRAERAEPSQYSSPTIWRNEVRTEVIAGGQKCRSYDPRTGRLLWQLDMRKGRSSATPLATPEMLYVGTEFRNRGGADDGGGFLFAVKPGGVGDISPSDEDSSSKFVSWRIEDSGLQMASPVLNSGHLYLLERRSGVLHCINAETGGSAYRKRIPGARAFWASPWSVGAHVFCLDENGTTHVVKGGEDFQVLGRNALEEQTWASPAIADRAVFLRTVEHLYCISEQ